MSKIYVEQWEVWSTAQYKLLAYDTDNLRKTFPNLQKMSDEEIKQYLEDNHGDIDIPGKDNQSGYFGEVIEQADYYEYNEYQMDEPTDGGCQVFTDSKEWESRAWWKGSNDLKCDDRSKDHHEIMSNFLDQIPSYEFK